MIRSCGQKLRAHAHTRLQNRAKGGGNYGTVGQRPASLHRCISGEKVTGAEGVKGEPSDNFCQSVDASASFRSEAWTYFGFLVWRNEKEEQWTDRQTDRLKTLRRHQNQHTPTAPFHTYSGNRRLLIA